MWYYDEIVSGYEWNWTENWKKKIEWNCVGLCSQS